MEKFLRVSFSLFILFVLGACNNSAAIKYDETVELGIKYIADENLTKAAEQFHLALQKKPEDNFSKTVIEQISLYQSALTEFENQNLSQAMLIAQDVSKKIEGSNKMNQKALELIERIKKDDEKYITNNSIETNAHSATASTSEVYTYEDFKGIYSMYEGTPYDSEVVVTYILSDDYVTYIIADWMEYTVSDITSIKIEDKNVFIQCEGEGAVSSPSDTFTAQLLLTDQNEKILITNGEMLYHMDQNQFEALEYNIDEELLRGL